MQKGRADRDAVWSFCDGDRLTWAPKRITWGPGPYPFGGKRQFKGICIRHLLGRKRPCILRVHRRQPTAGSIVPYTGASVSRRGDAGCRYHYCSGLFLFFVLLYVCHQNYSREKVRFWKPLASCYSSTASATSCLLVHFRPSLSICFHSMSHLNSEFPFPLRSPPLPLPPFPPVSDAK